MPLENARIRLQRSCSRVQYIIFDSNKTISFHHQARGGIPMIHENAGETRNVVAGGGGERRGEPFALPENATREEGRMPPRPRAWGQIFAIACVSDAAPESPI